MMAVQIIFDNCVADRLAANGIDPVRDLAGTDFQIAYTPDLKQEYEATLTHPRPSDQTKELLRRLLQHGKLISFFGLDEGPWLGFDQGQWASPTQIQTIESVPNGTDRPTGIPGNRTDSYLVALAEDYIVITANTNDAHWKNASQNRHVIQWERDLRPRLAAGATLAAALQSIIT